MRVSRIQLEMERWGGKLGGQLEEDLGGELEGELGGEVRGIRLIDLY